MGVGVFYVLYVLYVSYGDMEKLKNLGYIK